MCMYNISLVIQYYINIIITINIYYYYITGLPAATAERLFQPFTGCGAAVGPVVRAADGGQ